MNGQKSPSNVMSRRAELMAELFFQDFEPLFLSRPTSVDVGYDLLVGFLNEKAGINTFAIEVKATEEEITTPFRVPKSSFNRMAYSNVPGLLLVVDVKQNVLYCAWLKPDHDHRGSKAVPVELVRIDAATKTRLREQFTAAPAEVAAAS